MLLLFCMVSLLRRRKEAINGCWVPCFCTDPGILMMVMNKIYVPTAGVEDWQALLADPVKHWKTGYSARALAYCWEEASGFPPEIQGLFDKSQMICFKDIEPLLIIPEHKVPLPGGNTQSQNDVFVLARSATNLISISIEGKVSESFGPTLGEWYKEPSQGKIERLAYLKKMLGLCGEIDTAIRYQLLHRTASAVIEARKYHATKAVMIVHSFSQSCEWLEDYQAFVQLYGKEAQVGELVPVTRVDGVDLYVGWSKGSAEYLEI